MRRAVSMTVIAAAAALGTTAVSAHEFAGKPLTVTLKGTNNVEGGDPDGTGSATIRINPGHRKFCYILKVGQIAPANAAHIHRAPAGQVGDPVIHLDAHADGTTESCVSITRDLAMDIIRNPERYYINVHNAEYPAGAVRGQLR